MAEQMNRRDWLKQTTLGAGAMGAALGTALATGGTAAAADTMPRKKLGATGKEIPILVLGCSQSFDPVYDKLLHRAYADGVTYLDTAVGYAAGQSHSQIGPFVEQIGRENLWITSKVMLGGSRATPETFERLMLESLPALRTDYLDMFFMHSVRDPELLDEPFIRMGQDLKKRGIIHHFGFSCHLGTVVELLNKAAKIGPEGIDAVMFRYNFAQYGDLELNKAMDACHKAGVGMIAMKTQASVPNDKEEVQKFQSANFNLPQAKLKAVWADERLTAAVSEMTNTNMLRENVAAAKSTAQLSMNEFQQLNRYAMQTAHLRCNGCDQRCESQIAGDTKVADMLRFLMYAESYGKRDDAKRLFAQLSPAERQIAGIDFTGAKRACPQGIDIPERLAQAHSMLA